VDPREVARRRLRALGLGAAARPGSTPVDVIGRLTAVQAQDHRPAKWSVGQRVPGAREADLDALFDAGTFLRTHVLWRRPGHRR
jgi:Winged helix DNA-binding domain